MSRTFLPEWTPLDAVMITWPYEGSDWTPWLAEVDRCYLGLLAAITRYSRALVLCHPSIDIDSLRDRCAEAGIALKNCRFESINVDDTWVRDYGPITVTAPDGRLKLLDFRFNAWGGKYSASADDAVNGELARRGVFKAPLESVPFVLEGGAIDSDGNGHLLTTEYCLMNSSRNPDLSRDAVTARLAEYLGVCQVHWLQSGHLAGDDTDSHVDTLARFCSPDTIAYASCDDPDDVHYEPLQAMAAELAQLRTRAGRSYRLLSLPLPAPMYGPEGKRLPATYANFLVVNGAVLVPVYGCPQDDVALQTLKTAFPEHVIEPVDCAVLVQQFGSLHCATMQLPRGVYAHVE